MSGLVIHDESSSEFAFFSKSEELPKGEDTLKDIRKLIEWRRDFWRLRAFQILVQSGSQRFFVGIDRFAQSGSLERTAFNMAAFESVAKRRCKCLV